jgi:hypothetical protein
VCIPWDTSPYELSYYMERYWNMRSPKIVLSLISGVRHFKPWKNSRLKDQFKKGIIKVNANSLLHIKNCFWLKVSYFVIDTHSHF